MADFFTFDNLFGSRNNSNVSGSGTASGTTTSNGTQTNSGRTDTSSRTGTTNQTTVNSGSVNSTYQGPQTNTVNSSSSTYNSGRVDTSQVILTQEATDRLIQGILEGNQGLQAVTSGQRSSGGYNSTATGLLTNDLLARTAGEVAVRGAKTVNTIGSSSSSTSSTSIEERGAVFGQTNIGGSTSSTTGTIDDITTSILGESTTTQSGTSTQNTTQTQEQSTKNKKKGLFGAVGWIICTELFNQGKLSFNLFSAGSEKFSSYDEQIKRGYYIWAVPSTKHLKQHPNSLYSKFLEVLFVARAKHIAGERSIGSAIAYYGVHAVCKILSVTIARNYKVNLHTLYKPTVRKWRT